MNYIIIIVVSFPNQPKQKHPVYVTDSEEKAEKWCVEYNQNSVKLGTRSNFYAYYDTVLPLPELKK